MKLYYAPMACSMGIHLLLEEIGKPYEVQALPRDGQGRFEPEFAAINPKSKVPTLVRDDGSVLTEYGAIATWLARSNPQANLLPDDADGEVRVREALDFCVGELHKQGYMRVFRPDKVGGAACDADEVRQRGRDIVEKGYAVINDSLDDGRLAGQEFSIADSALFYVEYWSTVAEIDLPLHCAAHFERILARPSAKAMLQAEDLA